jgi:pantoate--beta-alanine ligase
MSLASAPQSIPQVLTRGGDVRALVTQARREGKTVGLVPTMGALHAGHLSLVDAAAAENDLVVVTIFVNPTQFNNPDDLAKYPRTVDADVAQLAAHGCHVVFAPAVEEMYGPHHATFVVPAGVAESLEGEHRPGHFRGVATIVLKLFNIVPADVAYFGRKDYQQSLVVEQIVRDLDVPITIKVLPTVRERDGLAMSSRNVRLSPDERRQAVAIHESLQLAADLVSGGERDEAVIRSRMREHLRAADVKLDYLQLVAEGTVTPVQRVTGRTVALVAGCVGQTRLIDNLTIG